MRNVSCANLVGNATAADNRRLPPPERRPAGKRPQNPSPFLSLSPHPRSLILMGCCARKPVGSHLPSSLNDWRVGTSIHAIKYGGVASVLAPQQKINRTCAGFYLVLGGAALFAAASI